MSMIAPILSKTWPDGYTSSGDDDAHRESPYGMSSKAESTVSGAVDKERCDGLTLVHRTSVTVAMSASESVSA
jgi:hypothetical protein